MHPPPQIRAALVVAHPGHELRVHGWLEVARPVVFVLTDGSGRFGHSRLHSTRKVLLNAGAGIGSIFGKFTDTEIYTAILQADFYRFTSLASLLAQSFFECHIEYVAGDASEGYSPTHDLCRLIVNAAVGIVMRRSHCDVGNFDFPLTGRPDSCPRNSLNDAIGIELDDVAFARKLAIARGYPELLPEVEKAISEVGSEAFRMEFLRPVCASDTNDALTDRPFYEQYGEARVAADYYSSVLRYREHMLPIAEALRRHVEGMDATGL